MLDCSAVGWMYVIFAGGGAVLVIGRRLADWVDWPPWAMWTVGLATVAWSLVMAWTAWGPCTLVKGGIGAAMALAGYAWAFDPAKGQGEERAHDRQQELVG